jgi:hypothetical protein
MNAFCALSKERVYGPFFVLEPTVSAIVYLNMLQQFLMKMTKKDAFTSSNPGLGVMARGMALISALR